MSNKTIHPGKYLLDQIMAPYGILPEDLAHNFDISLSVVENFLSGRRGITASMAISLDVAFPDVKMTAIEWMEMQHVHALAFVNERCSFDHIIPYRGVDPVDGDMEHEI